MSKTAAVPVQQAPRLGRFELRRVLGKGAQATVWLGFDPRLEREVAVKLMRPRVGNDAASVNEWLQEARNVSRLTHPNIVPVFEADTQEQQPYLVFEYVPGRTLAEHLRARGALPAREAVTLMLGVLDALIAAHAAGVVHRDLKPSNILVDGAGRARVMDFGIAARVQDANRAGESNRVVGTPGYMSPEAASGLAPTPAMDVFAAGLVLAETLSGLPLVQERDIYRAIYRVAHEDLSLPGDLAPEVDDALRGVVQRALARNPALRYPSAQALRDALQTWCAPAADAMASPAVAGSASNGTLEFLLRRMRHKTDFPAMSTSVAQIQRVANSENESIGSLTTEILKDVALTNKLLRLVNTVQYSHAGGGTISTVSRAVALIGFAGIRNMALSLVLLDHMQDKGHAQQLKEQFLRSLMAGSVASELCPLARETEEAFIGAMFHNLGRLLTEYYFPEEARQVRSIMAGAEGKESEEAVSTSVLGLSFEALGLGIAKTWGLPEGLQRCMRKVDGPVPSRPADNAQDRLRWTVAAGNDIADALLNNEPGAAKEQLTVLAERYAKALGMKSSDIESAAGQAKHKLIQMAQAMSISVAPASVASRLLRIDTKAEPAPARPADDTLTPHQLQATLTLTDNVVPLQAQSHEQAAAVLTSGIQDITNSMVENFKLNEVLRMILETMFRALAFRRVVFCLRDPKTNTLTGRFGLGDDAEAVAAAFNVPLKTGTDLFFAVCNKGVDTLISDATVPHIAQRLPPWYVKKVNAPAFLLLPLQIKSTPFALIYADMAQPGGITLDEKELSLLRTLRNQAVMAFRQAA